MNFAVLLTIVKFTGWVCTTCRESCKARFHNLETSHAKSAEEIASLSASLAGLQRDMHQLDDKLNNLFTTNTTNFQASAVEKSSYGTVDPTVISVTVHNTLQDMHRCQRNVIVSGFPEVDDVDDKITSRSFVKTI